VGGCRVVQCVMCSGCVCCLWAGEGVEWSGGAFNLTLFPQQSSSSFLSKHPFAEKMVSRAGGQQFLQWKPGLNSRLL
jgi:hypothetical protein